MYYVNRNTLKISVKCVYKVEERSVFIMKTEYIEAITKQLQECADMQLLDLIYKLLKKEGESNA